MLRIGKSDKQGNISKKLLADPPARAAPSLIEDIMPLAELHSIDRSISSVLVSITRSKPFAFQTDSFQHRFFL